jgi:hypothetical protein
MVQMALLLVAEQQAAQVAQVRLALTLLAQVAQVAPTLTYQITVKVVRMELQLFQVAQNFMAEQI